MRFVFYILPCPDLRNVTLCWQFCNSAELPLDDLATIKIVRGAGADEIEVPKVCTHLGVVVYKGRKVRR